MSTVLCLVLYYNNLHPLLFTDLSTDHYLNKILNRPQVLI